MGFYFLEKCLCEPLITNVKGYFELLSKECHKNTHLLCLILLQNTVFHVRRRSCFPGRSPVLESKPHCDLSGRTAGGGLRVCHNLRILIPWQLCCPVEGKLKEQLKSVSYHRIFQRMELVLLSSVGSVSVSAIRSV